MRVVVRLSKLTLLDLFSCWWAFWWTIFCVLSCISIDQFSERQHFNAKPHWKKAGNWLTRARMQDVLGKQNWPDSCICRENSLQGRGLPSDGRVNFLSLKPAQAICWVGSAALSCLNCQAIQKWLAGITVLVYAHLAYRLQHKDLQQFLSHLLSLLTKEERKSLQCFYHFWRSAHDMEVCCCLWAVSILKKRQSESPRNGSKVSYIRPENKATLESLYFRSFLCMHIGQTMPEMVQCC